jgi:Uma2 family endonuclease
MTYDEYLAFEEASPERHAFFDGEIYAMAGGTPAHARLQANVTADLRVALRGHRCAAYGPDLRIQFPADGSSAYADAAVVCGPIIPPPVDGHACTNPTLVCEVLSPSTEGIDRGRKFEAYRGLPSVQEVLLVAQHRPLLEVFRREPDGTWRLRTYGAGERAELASIGVMLDVDALYEGVLGAAEGAEAAEVDGNGERA